MYQKSNIVVLRGEDDLQERIANDMISEFAKKFPQYEIVVISEKDYKPFRVGVKKVAKTTIETFTPFLYRWYLKVKFKLAQKRLKGRQKVYSHFHDANKVKEGSRSGLSIVKNIVDRFKPKCVVVLDKFMLSQVVAAKRKYMLNTKVVYATHLSYFPAETMFFGVDKYIVVHKHNVETIANYGYPSSKIVNAKVCEYAYCDVVKSKERDRLGLDNLPTIMIVPSKETKGEYKKMIRNLSKYNSDINMLVYCGNNEKVISYFEKVKVSLDLYKMKIIDDFNKYIDACDYALATVDMQVIYKCFYKGVLPFVYTRKNPLWQANIEYYVNKGLALQVDKWADLESAIEKMFKTATLGTIMKDNAKQYIADIPQNDVYSAVMEVVKKVEVSQEKN